MIIADEGALKEILFNLLHNAIQAMPFGGKIYISANYQLENRVVQVTVADTGTGIPQDALEKIFEPFYTTKQTGTGLGLSIVKKKLEDMEATIRAESNGAGASFTLNFPLNEPILV